MTSSKSTKRALVSSALAILMCVAMLIGTTFAWFTDTASTGVNKIVSGNLKVDIIGADSEDHVEKLNFTKAATTDEEAGAEILWEPGCRYLTEGFRIANKGNLALKWKAQVNKGATEANEGNFDLLDVIDFYLVTKAADGTETATALDEFTGNLKKTETSEVYYIKGVMQTTAGNDYQGLTLDGITITVVATQWTYEKDSKDDQYDKFAEYDDVTTTQIPAGDVATVNNAVKDAIAAAKKVDSATGKTTPTQIVLPANTTVSIDSGVATPAQGHTSDIKITGDKTTTVKLQNTNPGSEGSLSYQDGANLTFQGITIDASAISGICARGGVVTFIDCEINTELKKTIGTKFVFSGCTFTQPVSQIGYGCKDVVFDNCKFNTNGYGIKIYSEGSTPVNLTVKNCAFKNTGSAAKSAIFIDHIIDGISYNITVDGCSFSGFTATPTANDNRYAQRMIVPSSFVKTSDQYIFSYQTGVEGEPYHKILTANQLVVTVK